MQRVSLLFFFLLPALMAQTVKVEISGSFDFVHHKHYAWRPHPMMARSGQADRFSVATQLVENYVNEALMKKGFVPDDLVPEFFVTRYVTARTGSELETVPAAGYGTGYYMWPGSWYAWSPTWFGAWDTHEVKYLEGILVLDIVDAAKKELVWRATGKDRIENMKERHENIQKVVDKAMKKFPPPYRAPKEK